MLNSIFKLERRIAELKSYRYRDMHELGDFLIKEDLSGLVNPSIPEWEDTESTIHQGEQWKGRDRYLWLGKTLRLPDKWNNLPDSLNPIGLFDFGMTGGGCSFGFESMVYLDGKPYQGVDTNHQEVFFKKEHLGRELSITFRLWSGLEGGGEPKEMLHEYKQASIGLLDYIVDDMYYLSDMIMQTARILTENSTERHDLLKMLEDAYLLVDWAEPGSEQFYDSVAAARECLYTELEAVPKHSQIVVSCVGHTHIDTAWLWRLKHTKEKASRSFSTVLRLMERYPEYYFLHTQPQQYEYIKEEFPEIFEQIREKIQSGQWEIDGAMWVEADCNIPSGESLTRQFLLGRKFMVEEFGKEPEYLWLPDVFGYSWALPQIMKKSGIQTFMTTKISWNQYNRMPNDTFWWRGIDGSEVLTHFITTPVPGQASDNFYATYNGELLPDTVQGTWNQYREKNLNKEVLIAYGHGDGGGGVTRDMLERRRRMNCIPGLPHVQTSTAGEYFRRLRKVVENTTEPMATWDGEMYLELHRGTYTSQAYSKKMNRRMEELYRRAEWLSVARGIYKGDLDFAEQKKLTEGWKIILTHQFHDIIPGSSIHEVYEDSVVNYEKASSIAEEIINNFYTEFSTSDKNIISIINEAAEDRNGMVWIPDIKAQSFVTEDGTTVVGQMEDQGTWIYVEDVPAMGFKKLTVNRKEETTETNCADVSYAGENEMFVSTPYYDIKLNQYGQIASLYDKKEKCQVLAEDALGNVLQVFEDKPISFDAWDIDMFYFQKMEEVNSLTNRVLVENGPLRTVIRQEWRFRKSILTQDMILYTKNPRIDFKTYVNWQETQKLLKVAFPVDIRTTYATYDVQYGNVRRTNNSNTSWDRARFESVAHRWVDLSEHGYGVSLLNNCKYGHDVHNNVIRLTLLKAAIYPDYAADKGEHEFTYSLLPHKGDFVEGNTVREAFDLNQPLVAVKGGLTIPVGWERGMLHLSGANVELDAIKKSEDGQYIVVRFHEYAGGKGDVIMKTGFKVEAFAECDLMERPIEAFRTGKMHYKIRPYEIKTVLIAI